MKRILTGVKPTGNGIHIGNYFGAVKPIIDISVGNQTFLMLADLHSLTSVHDKETLKANKRNVLKEYFSLLGDNPNIVVFEQSYLQRHTDIMWILTSVTPYSLMLRAHAFKDSQTKNSDINMAVFNYPILMAADIINFDIDLVPVGKDQKQHIEFTRDIAENFNNTYKTDFFKLPSDLINEDLGLIIGTDGRKMSKSYNNFIGVFEDEKVLKKKIMSIKTDDLPLEAVKNPDNCNVFSLIKLFANQDKQQEIRQKYLAGGYGYGHAKLELLDLILKYFKIAREKYNSFENDFKVIEKKLQEGNEIANKIVLEKYKNIKNIVGL
ncbi:MAG: tryptophan--tRNA ligase [Candidatus Gracilibacteria bacterium]|nr:tryptophan--tRNA ligase [Candidatus Gracilibacteria bacterium]